MEAMIIISFGSNVGNRGANLLAALSSMRKHGIHAVNTSAVYETPPWGITEQASFLNLIAAVETALVPEELMQTLLNIETALGRLRVTKWGPRSIDLDLLEYHGQQLETDLLTLPHPLYTERAFILKPMLDIDSAFKPTLGGGKTIRELVDGFEKEELAAIQPLDWNKAVYGR